MTDLLINVGKKGGDVFTYATNVFTAKQTIVSSGAGATSLEIQATADAASESLLVAKRSDAHEYWKITGAGNIIAGLNAKIFLHYLTAIVPKLLVEVPLRFIPTDGGGHTEYPEQSAAPDAVSNAALLYAEDNGSGKTRLVVRFPTGSPVVIATEP